MTRTPVNGPPLPNPLPPLPASNAAPLLLAATATVFYLLFASPAIGWRDGPEFTVTPVYLDVGHPSGFPTYNLLAKLFTWLPLGAIGFRVTLFTALMGGLSLFLIALLLGHLHGRKAGPAARPWLLAPLPLFALHQAVFASSTELEVYSLNTAFLVLLLYCAARWNSGDGICWLHAGGFLYGVACGNHAALSLYLPVLLLLTFWGEPEQERAGGPRRHLIRLGLLSAFFLAGLSVYLLLPVRSATDRLPVDFGRTNTLERLWRHVSDAKDSETHFKGFMNVEEISFLVPLQFRNLCSPFLFLLSLPFFAWGLRLLWKSFQILAVALPLLILINIVFFYYWIDGSSAFLPALTAWILPVCLGAGELGRLAGARAARWRAIRPAAAGLAPALAGLLVLAQLLSLAGDRMAESDARSGFQSTEIYFPDLAALPPESLALHGFGWFPLLALQHAYSARPDVTLVFLTGLANPGYMAVPEPGKMPLAYFPAGPDGRYVDPAEPGFPSLFAAANITEGRRVFVNFGPMSGDIMPYLVPDARFRWMGEMLMDHRAGAGAVERGLYDDYLRRTEAYWARLAGGDDGPPARKLPDYMYHNLYTVLEYLYSCGRFRTVADAAGRFLGTFTDPSGRMFLPHSASNNILALMTDSLRRAGDPEAALAPLAELIRLRPRKIENYLMLGYILDGTGDAPGALEAWGKGLELDPLDFRLIRLYAFALARSASLDAAAAFLDGRIQTLEKDGRTASSALARRLRTCFLTPPDAPEPAEALLGGAGGPAAPGVGRRGE
ncbi:MAG: DUF2723 domain-containing protein [Deltaproteobacteria bacterium]|jgi:hypothetical protein|nr:DUF2723 domain-containing protein [Deltaproteobacteria bacterium]